MEGSRARKERDGMFVVVVTPPSAVVELQLFNDVVREVLFMLPCVCVRVCVRLQIPMTVCSCCFCRMG